MSTTTKTATFSQWLAKHCDHETAVGDLARDVLDDRQWPGAVESRHSLLCYLRKRGACHEAIETAKQAWRNYTRTTGATP